MHHDRRAARAMHDLARRLFIAFAAGLLAACATASRTPLAPPEPPVLCDELGGTVIPPARIGLPTGGARVTRAFAFAASGVAPKTLGPWCKLSVEIAPVDPAAPVIHLQVALPEDWNGRAMMLGGGGYDGTVPDVAGNVPAGPVDRPNPLGRGYATFASDSGHAASTDPANLGVFALNDEALLNFSYAALKKTRDVALALIHRRYGREPAYRYFAGGSSGGREALAVAQKWPADFDGVIALYPATAAASLDLQFGRITRALARPGAYPNLAKRAVLLRAAMQACDGLDGVEDGVISNQAACNARFDPDAAQVDGHALRCAAGGDTGDDCLSDAQIAALRVIDSAIVFGYPLASGETGYPGFNTWGTDFGRPGGGVQQLVSYLGLNTVAPAQPMPSNGPTGGVPYLAGFWNQWVRWFVTKDPSADVLALDPQDPGPWQARISALTALQDVPQADFAAFAARGGRLLIAHGVADQLVSTRATEDTVARITAALGPAATSRFLRYYEIPGYGHAGSAVFNAAWDSVTTLEAWVEHGVAPPPQVVADTGGVPGRTRPLCEYPGWPRYLGSGDVNVAASFACTGR